MTRGFRGLSEEACESGIGSERNELEADLAVLHERKMAEDGLRRFGIFTLKREDGFVTIGTEIEFTEDSSPVHFP